MFGFWGWFVTHTNIVCDYINVLIYKMYTCDTFIYGRDNLLTLFSAYDTIKRVKLICEQKL